MIWHQAGMKKERRQAMYLGWCSAMPSKMKGMMSWVRPPPMLPQPPATALAVPTMRALNMVEHQNWQACVRAGGEEGMEEEAAGRGGRGKVGSAGGSAFALLPSPGKQRCSKADTYALLLRLLLLLATALRDLRLSWQVRALTTKVAREKPMHMRQAMKPPALVTSAMPKVAMEVMSCSTPWPYRGPRLSQTVWESGQRGGRGSVFEPRPGAERQRPAGQQPRGERWPCPAPTRAHDDAGEDCAGDRGDGGAGDVGLGEVDVVADDGDERRRGKGGQEGHEEADPVELEGEVVGPGPGPDAQDLGPAQGWGGRGAL